MPPQKPSSGKVVKRGTNAGGRAARHATASSSNGIASRTTAINSVSAVAPSTSTSGISKAVSHGTAANLKRVANPGTTRTSSSSKALSTNGTSTSTARSKPSASTSTKKVSNEAPKVSSRPAARVQPAATDSSASDPVHTAAQVYSWFYMTATMKECHEITKQKMLSALDARSKELDAEEEAIADMRTRNEAERLLDFYDEISQEQLSTRLPALMNLYISNEHACSLIIAKALQLTNTPERDARQLRTCNTWLDSLDELEQEISQIESDIVALSKDCVQNPSRIRPVLQALLPIICSRYANLTTARSLILSHKENIRTWLEIESLKHVS